jgi:hypothetical protein
VHQRSSARRRAARPRNKRAGAHTREETRACMSSGINGICGRYVIVTRITKSFTTDLRRSARSAEKSLMISLISPECAKNLEESLDDRDKLRTRKSRKSRNVSLQVSCLRNNLGVDEKIKSWQYQMLFLLICMLPFSVRLALSLH